MTPTPYMENNAVWPSPPYYYFAKSAEKLSVEACIVNLLSGKELTGQLILFSAEHSRILFQPENGNISEIILFDQIKCLKLTRPVELLREQIFFEILTEMELLPPVKQSYAVEFTDNTSLTGFTSGFVNTEAGLYIYPHDDKEKVARYFMPRHSIKSYKIGVPIDGMSLVADNATESALEYKNEPSVKSIGDYLIENQINTTEELKWAIAHKESRAVVKLGEALEQTHLLTDEQLQAALEKQKQNRVLRLGKILIDMGIIDEQTLNGVLAKKLGIPYINLAKFDFDPKVLGIVSESLARKLLLMPLCIHESKLVAAFENPLDAKAIDELGFNTQMAVLPAMASREDILSAIESHYNRAESGLAWDGVDHSDVKYNDDGAIDFE